MTSLTILMIYAAVMYCTMSLNSIAIYFCSSSWRTPELPHCSVMAECLFPGSSFGDELLSSLTQEDYKILSVLIMDGWLLLETTRKTRGAAIQ